jgi:hypothetical protein
VKKLFVETIEPLSFDRAPLWMGRRTLLVARRTLPHDSQRLSPVRKPL